MGFEIPEPYCWDESFKVFYDLVDEQHKGLFQGIFAVAENRACKDSLNNLNKVFGEHFATEEEMMEKAKYADYHSHKKIHDEFAARLGKVESPVSDDDVNWAKNWLVQHIKGIDLSFKDKL
ncbi:PREDICTED: neurohemerythrin-like [Priapulus caudatus]|uniref:Neurohemerythrin-like n=1 Tax=Priapulus caudatus TaxID=37621 RepID=A0ABM1DQG9_PRICU|nr:PREDICTED: neurohemerythrin-like [Priapulus caudatus]